MQALGDLELLAEYARNGSEEAFATLVSRHINLVYGAAMRQTGNPHQAEEISQAVFIILAKKAATIGSSTILPGWLFKTTRLTAANLRRNEFRRAQREREAFMQPAVDDTEEEDIWQQVAPMLDAAMAGLREMDRNALLMRFMEGKSLQEVGAAMGTTEAAAQKRVNRAVEKLRMFFTKRGVVLTGAALGGALAAKSAPAAPSEFVAAVKTVAAAKGSTAGASTLALTKGTLKTMGWSNTKVTAATFLAAALLTGGVLGVVEAMTAKPDGLSATDIYNKTRQRYDTLKSFRAYGEEAIDGGPARTFFVRFARPDYFRIEWTMPVFTPANVPMPNDLGAIWSAGKGTFMVTGPLPPPGSGRALARSRQFPYSYYSLGDLDRAWSSVASLAGSAVDMPAALAKLKLRDKVEEFSPAAKPVRQKDEKIDGVNCFVLSRTFSQIFRQAGRQPKETFWIGKKDFLIHQVRTETYAMNGTNLDSSASLGFVLTKYKKIVTDEPFRQSDFEYPVPAGVKYTDGFP